MNDIKKGENAEDDETVSQSPTPKTSDNGAGTTRQRELAFSKAVEAINCLKSISASNPARKRAFQKVGDYIKHNIKEMK